MRKFVYALAVLLLVAPNASWAIGGLVVGNDSKSMNASGIAVTGASLSFGATAAGLFNGGTTVGTVNVAVALEEFGVDMQSPAENYISFSGDIGNTAVADGILNTAQQSVGAANVTLSLNSLISGLNAALGSGGLCTSAGGCDQTLAFVLATNPAFTVLNSYPVAQMLLVREAINAAKFGTASLAGTGAIGIELLNVGVAEFSPHQNAGLFAVGSAGNLASIGSAAALVTIQQQIGVANVQAAVNQISAATGSVSITGIGF